MKRFAILSMACLLAVSCSKNDSSTKVVTTSGIPAGQSGVQIQVTYQSDCSASSATASLSSQYGSAFDTRNNIPNGGRVDFITQAGQYTLTVTAGICSVSGTVQSQINPYVYTVCLGSSCSVYKTGFQKVAAKVVEDTVPCAWGVYGCQGTAYAGSGGAVMKLGTIRFASKKATPLDFDMTYGNGSARLASSPIFGKLELSADGQITSDGVTYSTFSHDVQVDEQMLQSKEGFCDKRGAIVGRMADYLRTAGFSAGAVDGFVAQWSTKLPPNDELCAYPQSDAEIREIANYKADRAISAQRVWFLVVPQMEAAVLKIKPLPTKYQAFASKPNRDAFAALKKGEAKTRSIANDADVTAEETGLVFLLER